MHPYQQQFIKFCLTNNIIQLGEFTLKSGRKSPYFFNAGLFNTGHKIKILSEFYTQAILKAKLDFDIIFGPAYKGIPLAVSTAITLATQTNRPIPFCFNRKVSKDHGEGGALVGAPLEGKILLIDDVITAGTAIHESIQWINPQKAKLSSIMIALDRQEKGQKGLSAVQEITQQYQAPVNSIIKFEHLIEYIQMDKHYHSFIQQVQQYHHQYGI